MICECCKDTGVFHLVGGKKICTCKIGKLLIRKIKNGGLCPVCNNTGIYPIYDPVYHEVNQMYFCRCKHGQEAEEAAKNDPKKCKICHGTNRYVITNDKGEKISMGHCIHLLL